MKQEAKVKIELDTEQAKASLRELAKEGEKSAGRVDDAVSGGLGRSTAIGAAAGFGFGLAQRAASRLAGFIPNVISEGTVGVRSRLDALLVGPEARAAQSAREQTKDAYAEIVGRMKNPSVTPEIRNYYNNVKGLREITERGGAAINKEFGDDFLDDAVKGITDVITAGFDRIIDALPLGGK